ncbi:hypothetical protein AAFP35_09265 [Gordonia sp. CPCC 206044]|uniref:hypothetical protein n=1 Tax=Gordonia sp. CPCC 206044 TaxID=3140793 RepID=UPI003AF3D468
MNWRWPWRRPVETGSLQRSASPVPDVGPSRPTRAAIAPMRIAMDDQISTTGDFATAVTGDPRPLTLSALETTVDVQRDAALLDDPATIRVGHVQRTMPCAAPTIMATTDRRPPPLSAPQSSSWSHSPSLTTGDPPVAADNDPATGGMFPTVVDGLATTGISGVTTTPLPGPLQLTPITPDDSSVPEFRSAGSISAPSTVLPSRPTDPAPVVPVGVAGRDVQRLQTVPVSRYAPLSPREPAPPSFPSPPTGSVSDVPQVVSTGPRDPADLSTEAAGTPAGTIESPVSRVGETDRTTLSHIPDGATSGTVFPGDGPIVSRSLQLDRAPSTSEPVTASESIAVVPAPSPTGVADVSVVQRSEQLVQPRLESAYGTGTASSVPRKVAVQRDTARPSELPFPPPTQPAPGVPNRPPPHQVSTPSTGSWPVAVQRTAARQPVPTYPSNQAAGASTGARPVQRSSPTRPAPAPQSHQPEAQQAATSRSSRPAAVQRTSPEPMTGEGIGVPESADLSITAAPAAGVPTTRSAEPQPVVHLAPDAAVVPAALALQPTATHPTAMEPLAMQRSQAEPTAIRRAATQPVATQPAATQRSGAHVPASGRSAQNTHGGSTLRSIPRTDGASARPIQRSAVGRPVSSSGPSYDTSSGPPDIPAATAHSVTTSAPVSFATMFGVGGSGPVSPTAGIAQRTSPTVRAEGPSDDGPDGPQVTAQRFALPVVPGEPSQFLRDRMADTASTVRDRLGSAIPDAAGGPDRHIVTDATDVAADAAHSAMSGVAQGVHGLAQIPGAATGAITNEAITDAATAMTAPRTGAGAEDLEELARRLHEPLSARLRTELWLDRERSGLLTDR